MTWVAVAIGGGAVIGAVASSKSSRNAADAQVSASNNANATQLQASQQALQFQREQANLAQSNQQPWRTAGVDALAQLQRGLNPNTVPASSPVNAAGQSKAVYDWINQSKKLQYDLHASQFKSSQAAAAASAPGFGDPFGAAGVVNNNDLYGQLAALKPIVADPGAWVAPDPWVEAGTAPNVNAQTGFLVQPSTAFSQPNTAFSKPNTAFSTPNTAFSTPNTAFSKPFDFQADPGYAFRKQQGQDALDNSAAAHGGLLSGAQLKAAGQYNQNFASNEYSNAYNRYQTDNTGAFNRYQTTNTDAFNRYQATNTDQYNRYMQDNTAQYNRYQTDNTGQYNRDITGQTNQFNRLASVAGLGQVAANQMSSNQMALGSSVGGMMQQTAGQIANNQIGAGNAQAAGMIGQSNALTSGISNGYNMYQGQQYMNRLQNQGASAYMNNAWSNVNPFSNANQYYGKTGVDENGYTTSSTGAYTG